MIRRMDVHELAEWVEQTPEDVWAEIQRARRSEDELLDALESVFRRGLAADSVYDATRAILVKHGRLPR